MIMSSSTSAISLPWRDSCSMHSLPLAASRMVKSSSSISRSSWRFRAESSTTRIFSLPLSVFSTGELSVTTASFVRLARYMRRSARCTALETVSCSAITQPMLAVGCCSCPQARMQTEWSCRWILLSCSLNSLSVIWGTSSKNSSPP